MKDFLLKKYQLNFIFYLFIYLFVYLFVYIYIYIYLLKKQHPFFF